MIEVLLRVLLRCSHRDITRPITPLDRFGNARDGTYVVCLSCGTKMPYDWDSMRLGRYTRPVPSAKVLRPE